MITDLSYLKPVWEFLEIPESRFDNHYLNRKSISKWKTDKLYGFKLSADVINLAEEYGYRRDEMTNESYTLWPLYRSTLRGIRKIIITGKRILGSVQSRDVIKP